MADYTFYTNPMSRGQVARWALHEVGADYEQVLVDWENKPEALLHANPMGKVPTLIHHSADGERVVTETAAICHYLAEMHPNADLLPTESEKADYFRYLFFAAAPIESVMIGGAMGWEVPEGKEGMVGFGTRELAISALDTMLRERDYVCGSRFTMADVYVGSQINWAMDFELLPKQANFVAYAERCRGRPAYAEAKKIDMDLIAEMQGAEMQGEATEQV